MSQPGAEPAFPNVQMLGSLGLTKREWFAGMALQALLSSSDCNCATEDYAKVALIYADFLLAAIQEKKESA